MNAELLRDVFQGGTGRQAVAIANTLIFNAAVAIYLYGLQPSVAAAIPLAREKLLDGSAMTTLTHLVEFSND